MNHSILFKVEPKAGDVFNIQGITEAHEQYTATVLKVGTVDGETGCIIQRSDGTTAKVLIYLPYPKI